MTGGDDSTMTFLSCLLGSEHCAIVAQVFEDGMVVKLLDKAEVAALRRALGGDPTKIVHTSDEHMKVSSAKGGAA